MTDPLQSTEGARLPQKTCSDFLESLHRIFKIGTYYPEGHMVLDRAANLLQHNLQKITEGKRSARVELKGTIILVEGQEVPVISPPISEMNKLFQDLEIGLIEIDRIVSVKDLLRFTKTLLLNRSQLLSVKQFTKAEVVDLPSTIRITQKEFLIDEGSILGESRNDEEGGSLDSVFHMLEEEGLDRQQLAQCREFLNTLARKFESNQINIKGMPAISWQDVRKLMAKVVTGAFYVGEEAPRTLPQSDLTALSAIFNGLRQELDDNESRDAINLLVRAFNRGHIAKNQQTTKVVANRQKSLSFKDKGTDMTIGEIHIFVHDNYPEVILLDKIKKDFQLDELAILLQMLPFPLEPKADENLRRNLRNVLATSFSLQKVDVLIKGVVHLAGCAEPRKLREAIDLIALQVRSTAYPSLLVLVMICHQLQPTFIEFFWPTLINEMLAVGRQEGQKRQFDELAAIAAGVPVKTMRDNLPELEGIQSIKERKIAHDIFIPELKTAFPIYAVLMETSMRTQIASRVLNSLRAAPPDWFIEAVSPLLDLAQPEHLKFLHSYLTITQKQFPISLHVMAGKLVVELLPMIDETARNDSWVARTITATAKMQVEGTREMLEKIVVEKKLFLIPKWPSACRQAAMQALRYLKRKPLG